MDDLMLAKELPFLKIRLKENIVFPAASYQFKIVRYAIEEILDYQFIQEMTKSMLDLREVQLFITPPNSTGQIHIDGHKLNLDAAAINFVLYNNTNWSMQWFDTSVIDVKKNVSSGNTDYISLLPNDCKLIAEFNSADPFIVQIGTAHRIINHSKFPRYCLSLRFKQNDFSSILKHAIQFYTEI